LDAVIWGIKQKGLSVKEALFNKNY
jgi:hypothetical protein